MQVSQCSFKFYNGGLKSDHLKSRVPVFNGSGLNYSYGLDHSKTRPFKIWTFLFRLQMIFDKMAFMSPVSSVLHAEVTVNIGLKDIVRVAASIPSIRSVQQQLLQNKTLFNSCERILLGTLILNIKNWR